MRNKTRTNRFKARLRAEGIELNAISCTVSCMACGTFWLPDDPDTIGQCPLCSTERGQEHMKELREAQQAYWQAVAAEDREAEAVAKEELMRCVTTRRTA